MSGDTWAFGCGEEGGSGVGVAHLNGRCPHTQRGLAAEFVQDCLALLREPFDYYEYATPHLPGRRRQPRGR